MLVASLFVWEQDEGEEVAPSPFDNARTGLALLLHLHLESGIQKASAMTSRRPKRRQASDP